MVRNRFSGRSETSAACRDVECVLPLVLLCSAAAKAVGSSENGAWADSTGQCTQDRRGEARDSRSRHRQLRVSRRIGLAGFANKEPLDLLREKARGAGDSQWQETIASVEQAAGCCRDFEHPLGRAFEDPRLPVPQVLGDRPELLRRIVFSLRPPVRRVTDPLTRIGSCPLPRSLRPRWCPRVRRYGKSL